MGRGKGVRLQNKTESEGVAKSSAERWLGGKERDNSEMKVQRKVYREKRGSVCDMGERDSKDVGVSQVGH